MPKKRVPASNIEKEFVDRLKEVVTSEAGIPYPYASKKPTKKPAKKPAGAKPKPKK